MYKLLIVDDEDFEREGIAQLIDWEKHGIQMAGTAWNGVDALQKTEALHPDMILTDIKMPVMNGIELIRKVGEKYPDIEFAVLSGYGEYEFTSQAMEEGVRHYILKPCDEEKILETMEKVKKDVDRKREKARKERDYMNRAMPQAQKQLFRNLLLAREAGNEAALFQTQGKTPGNIRLLVFRSVFSFDGLEEFMLENMLEELLESEQIRALASTVVRNDAVVLISEASPEKLINAVSRIQREFGKGREEPIRAALSGNGQITVLAGLYRQTEELFRIGEVMADEPLLHYGMFEGKKQDVELLIDFDIVGKTTDYAELLQSLQLSFLRMQKKGFSLSEKREIADWMIRLLYGEELETDEECMADESGQSLMVSAARQIFRHMEEAGGKDGQRYRKALEEIYCSFQDQRLCLHWLTTEVLYINEDYFGRFFRKMNGKRFTEFIQDTKISIAERIMQLEPDIMVYEVSEMLGYAPDGQYFSKVFRKSKGMTPGEYREKMQRERKAD